MNKVLVVSSSKEYIAKELDIKFDKIIILENKNNYEKIVSEIKKYNEAYFIDFEDEYRKILPLIPFKTKCISILTNEIAEFTDVKIFNKYREIIEFYDRLIIKKILVFNYDFYEVMKNANYDVELINIDLDLNVKKVKNNKKIVGIISSDTNPNNNFYNILTALTMTHVDEIKLICNSGATKEFIERFRLPVKYCNNIDEVIDKSSLNIYSNFTSTNIFLLKKSLDKKIPCIIGNSDYKLRKDYDSNLVLVSDDDVGELKDKINQVLE